MKRRLIKTFLAAVLLLRLGLPAQAQPGAGTTALIVIAHPDDETGFAATVYKITHELHGHVDLALITNGEGGYKYSTLAEDYYHLELTDEKTGRENLPRIRKEELMNAGKIIGIRNYFFLDQWDRKYTTDERDPLDTAWDVALVRKRLIEIMTKTNYDFVFCLLPVLETHGHHKAATILALETINKLPPEHRPVILGVTDSEKNDTTKTTFVRLKEYSVTAVDTNIAPFKLDRTTKFGFKNSLDYKIIVNWEIAEHKSQGTMQLGMNRGDFENFWYFKLNGERGLEKTKTLFEELKKIPYPSKTY
ncbi:MAG: PIG-L family deacetylase [Bacteroidetes bacterium]|nr:PIG-L family deacetylase [Bacteroidota bacterium]